MSVDQFRYLWTDSAGRYVLIRLAPDSVSRMVIFDRQDLSVVLVDDDDLSDQVVRRMIDAGVEILDDFPRDGGLA